MSNTENRLKPTERKMGGATIALGVIGFLTLAGGFFFLGMKVLGPMLSPHASPVPPTEQSAEVSPTMPLPKADHPASSDALEIQITEETEKQQAALDAAESGVKQDDNSLTVTLDPNDSTGNNGSESADKPAANDKTAPEPTPADAVADSSPKVRYHVQAGTFANRVNAENLANELRNKGYKPQINTVGREAGTLHRVELGDYKTRQVAEDLAADLSSKGYNPTVTFKRGN